MAAFSVPKDVWEVPSASDLTKLGNLARRVERQGGHNGVLPARRVAVGPEAAELNTLGTGGASGAIADPDGQPVVFSGLAQNWQIRQNGRYELMRRIGAVRMDLRPCTSIANPRGPGLQREQEISIFEFFGERSPSVGHFVLCESNWHRVHRALRGGYDVPKELEHVGEHPLFSAGRRGTGVGFQRHSESWMAQAFGRKIWVLIPPHHSRPKVAFGSWWRILPDSESRQSRCGWFTCSKRSARVPKLKSPLLSAPPDLHDPKAGPKSALPADARICLAHPGDIIFVPRGWWHASLNIDDFSLAIGWKGSINLVWDESMRAVLSGEIESVQKWCSTQLPSQLHLTMWGAMRLAAEAGDEAQLEALLKLPQGKEALRGERCGDIVAAAARTGQVEILEMLSKAGANLRASERAGGSQAVHILARDGHIRAVAWLVGQKVDLEAVDIYGRPMHYAAYFGHQEVITLLLRCRANADAGLTFARGHRALDSDEATNAPLALANGPDGVKQAMCRCGDRPEDWDAFAAARPTPLNGSGVVPNSSSLQLAQRRTPLHLASAQGHMPSVTTLLKASADANAMDQWGLDPFSYAEAAGHKNVAIKVAEAAAAALGDSSSEDGDSDAGVAPRARMAEPEPEMAPGSRRR